MNNEPLVTVITVCYNAEKTIRRTIESVFQQTYKRIEYIIVDGGSIDSTVSIIKSYSSGIAKVISEKDYGISDAFNKGIHSATGELIQFINADDTLDINKIKNSVQVLVRNPNASFVFGDIIKNHPSGRRDRIPGDPQYARSISFVMNRVNHPTMVVRKSLFDRYGIFDVQWKIAMDYDWILRIHKAGMSGVYSSDCLVETQAGGISDEQRIFAFRECRDISIRHGLNRIIAYGYYYLRILKHTVLKLTGGR